MTTTLMMLSLMEDKRQAWTVPRPHRLSNCTHYNYFPTLLQSIKPRITRPSTKLSLTITRSPHFQQDTLIIKYLYASFFFLMLRAIQVVLWCFGSLSLPIWVLYVCRFLSWMHRLCLSSMNGRYVVTWLPVFYWGQCCREAYELKLREVQVAVKSSLLRVRI